MHFDQNLTNKQTKKYKQLNLSTDISSLSRNYFLLTPRCYQLDGIVS